MQKRGSIFELTKRIIVGSELEEGHGYLYPVHSMLAYQEEDIFSALKRTGFPVICDFKIDGVRIIVHRKGDAVRIFSRKLRDLSEELREIVLEIKRFPYNEFIIDRVLIVESEAGKPFSFQDIISIISRGSNLFSTWKVKPFFFDVLKLGKKEIWKKLS